MFIKSMPNTGWQNLLKKQTVLKGSKISVTYSFQMFTAFIKCKVEKQENAQ